MLNPSFSKLVENVSDPAEFFKLAFAEYDRLDGESKDRFVAGLISELGIYRAAGFPK